MFLNFHTSLPGTPSQEDDAEGHSVGPNLRKLNASSELAISQRYPSAERGISHTTTSSRLLPRHTRDIPPPPPRPSLAVTAREGATLVSKARVVGRGPTKATLSGAAFFFFSNVFQSLAGRIMHQRSHLLARRQKALNPYGTT